MTDGLDQEQPSDKVVNLDSAKAKRRKREGGRFWEGLWRLWPERAYRPWDARPYDFDNYPELWRRGKSTR
jgi:hypothetical protein